MVLSWLSWQYLFTSAEWFFGSVHQTLFEDDKRYEVMKFAKNKARSVIIFHDLEVILLLNIAFIIVIHLWFEFENWLEMFMRIDEEV